MFIGYYNKSIILTFISLFLCIFGISMALNNNVTISFIILIICGICDCFDGYIASFVKRTENEKKYGVELDSIVDIVCYGVYPIIISFSLGYNSIYNILIYFIYIFSSVTRLCYFNIDENNKKYFKGVPITTISFILPVILAFTTNELFLMFTLLVFSFLYLLNIKINKLKIRYKWLMLLLGIILIILIIIGKML